MKKNTILGDVHLFDKIVLRQLTWKTCRQPSWIHGSDPRPLTQQIVQYASSSTPSSSKLGSSPTPTSIAAYRAFAAHSALRHGRH